MVTRLMVVDDHALVREGIVKLVANDPDIRVVGEGSDGFEAVEKAKEIQPDAILMDLYMPGLDGISATRIIKRDMPDVHVVLISGSLEEEDIIAAIEAGARGYILKTSCAESLIKQIKQVVSGGVALTEDVTSKLVAGLSRSKHVSRNTDTYPYDSITQREKEVLSLVAEGKANKGIGEILYVSENTIRAHVRSLMQKLALENRTQLAIYGVREGLGTHNGTTSRNSTQPDGIA